MRRESPLFDAPLREAKTAEVDHPLHAANHADVLRGGPRPMRRVVRRGDVRCERFAAVHVPRRGGVRELDGARCSYLVVFQCTPSQAAILFN